MKALPPSPIASRRRRTLSLILAGSIAAVVATQTTHAASANWNTAPTDGNWVASGGENNWSTGANLFPGATTGVTNADTATFLSSSTTAISINSATLNVKGITFGTATTALSAFTIGSTSGSSLFLTSGGTISFAADTTPTGTTETINAPLVMEGSYSITNSNADATNVLNIGGTISNGTTGALILTLGGANTGVANTVSGAITDGTSGGVTSVTKSTTGGVWTLSGNNTYSGVTTVGAGTLYLMGDNSGASGGVIINSATLKIGSATALGTGTLTLNNASNFDNGTGGSLTLTTNNAMTWGVAGGSGSTFLGSNNLNLGTGPIALGAGLAKAFTLVTNNAGVSLTVGGVISGVGNFTKGGAGTLILTGANTFTGGTSFGTNGGIINYQNGIAFGTNSAITVSSGNTVQVQGGITGGSLALSLSGTGASNATGVLENVSDNNSYNGVITATGATISSDAGTLTMTGGVNANASTLTTTGSGNITIATTGISNTNSGGLIKNGNGTLTLSAANTYTGATTINLGTLALNGGSLAATAVTVGKAAVTLTSGNATLQIDGNNTAAGSVALKGGDGITTGQGTLSLVDGTINTLTLSSTATGTVLTMGSATAGTTSFVDLEVGATADSIVISTGKLSVLGSVTVNITGLGGLNGTQQTLISAGNNSGTNFALGNFTLNTSGNLGGYTVSLANDSSTAGQKLFLNETANAAPTTAYWKGTNGDGVWNSFTGGNTNTSNFTTDSAGTANANGALAGTTNVVFNATGASTFANTTLGADTTINSLTFNSSATGSVGIGGPNVLTINASNVNGNTAGNGITITSGSGNPALSTKIALGADQTWTVTDATSTLTASNQISGAFALTKAGAGTLVLSGANTYTGATTVSSGKLIVSGSLNGTTAVNVMSGATLASGASGGTITTSAVSGDALNVSGTLSPGDTNLAPITLTLATGTKLNFNSGSELRLDVATAGSSDSVIFGGSAGDWLSGAGNATLALNGTIDYTSTYLVFQNVSTTGFTFATITGYDTADWTAHFALSGSNYQLTFSAIPEPGSPVSLIGGLGMFLGLQRLRRRRA